MRAALVIIMFFSFSQAEKLYFVEDPWPPYTYGKVSKAPTKGAAVDALKQIFENAEIELMLLPWKRAIEIAKAGKADGLMLTIATNEREKYFVFTEALFSQKIVFISKADLQINYTTFSDLKNYKIATVIGSKYSDSFQKAIKEIPLQIEEARNIQTNIKKLYAKRVDLLVASLPTFCGALEETNLSAKDFRALNTPIAEKKFKIAISKKSSLAKKVDSVNQKILQLQENGVLQNIKNRYFNQCIP